MGADQALQWEIVLSNGTFVKATPDLNHDLYWALSGGRPGAYGVVVSLTIRAFKDTAISGGTLSFTTEGVSNDTFRSGVEAWLSNVPALVDAGATATNVLTRDSFLVSPITVPDASQDDVRELVKPVTDKLAALEIQYTLDLTAFPTYFDHFNNCFTPLGWQFIDRTMGGRFVPRTVLQSNTKGLVKTIREVTETTDSYIALVAVSSSADKAIAPNAVFPKWRDMNINIVAQTQWHFGQPFSANLAQLDTLNNVITPKLEAATPRAGAYGNEAYFLNPNWKEDFYGVNYERLRKLKAKYDSKHLFTDPLW